jgi:hypothetical protein
MPIAEAYSGSATIGTATYSLPNASTTLTPIDEPGVYQVFIDTANISFGDSYRIEVLEKVTAAGSQRGIYEAVISGVMADSWVSPSLIFLHGWDVRVTKISGTDRALSWSVRKVA